MLPALRSDQLTKIVFISVRYLVVMTVQADTITLTLL
jgi:hypothetical protein